MRDQHLLESAVYRHQATFGGSDLYPDVLSKAASLGHSIINNHPFVDGNKRTGFEAMRLFLRLNGLDLRVGEEERFRFVMEAASDSKVDEQAFTAWLKRYSVKRKGPRGRPSPKGRDR